MTRVFRCDGTFDLECAEWDKFCLGVIYDGHRPQVFYSGDELIDELRRRGGVWWAHAGGVYDLLYVLERARARGIPCQVDRSQHRITRIVMGKLTLRDSYALWPVPLDEIAGALGVPVPSLPWPCVCNKDCGGYCQIGPRAAQGDPDLEDYCKADCRVLYDGLHLLADFAAEHGIRLRGTLGSTAWAAAQSELGVPDSEIPWPIWRHARRGDKGGRIAIIRPRVHGPGAHHDICNAYPAQLAKAELPVGGMRELGNRQALLALGRMRPGIYTLTVNVPDSLFLPPLPWSQGGQLCFPVGTFTGSWTIPEIACALERGVSITEAHSALVWEATAPIFAPLVERWYAIRRAIGRKTPLGQWIGRLAKALTGKFAERPERSRVMFHPESIKVCLRNGQCKNGCTKRCGAYEQLDLDGHIYAIPYQRLGSSAYPQWSAYLRAMTRVQWLEQAERFGESLAFGNTDSLWHTSRGSPEPLGDGLGQWEYQHSFTDLEIRSPNTYAFRDDDGKLEIRGVPGITEEDWKRGAGTIDRGVVTFGSAVKTAKGLFRKRHRRWSLPEGERLWWGDRKLGDRGVTHPAHAEEIREVVRIQKQRRAERLLRTSVGGV